MKKILLFALISSFFTTAIFAASSPGDIIITEFMANPDFVSDSNGEYFEIYNTTGAPIDLNSWVVCDAGSNSFTISTSLIIQPGEFLVFGINGNTAENGGVPVDFDYPGGFALTNTDDEIIIKDDMGTVIISVCYTDGDASGAGVALELELQSTADDGKSLQGDFIASTTQRPNGVDFGTPGEAGLTALPVELTRFIAKLNNKLIDLTWTTASELNNSHFDIEYSIDGINFRAIDEVKGNGTTQERQEYTYTHTTPANGTNYYRLKQVDFDGAFEYSDIRVVKIERNGKIVINPSAATAEITVELAEISGNNNLIGIYDMVGRTVMMSNFDGNLNTKTIDISSLQKGYYVVRVQAGSQIFTERFIKMVN